MSLALDGPTNALISSQAVRSPTLESEPPTSEASVAGSSKFSESGCNPSWAFPSSARSSSPPRSSEAPFDPRPTGAGRGRFPRGPRTCFCSRRRVIPEDQSDRYPRVVGKDGFEELLGAFVGSRNLQCKQPAWLCGLVEHSFGKTDRVFSFVG